MASRDERVARLKQLIGQNPSWGKDRLNSALKQEFGVGLRRIYVAQTKYELLYGRPNLVERRYRTLLKEKFLPTEARYFSQFPISSKAVRAFRSERIKFIRESKRAGIPPKGIFQQIRMDYHAGGHVEKRRIRPDLAYRAFLKEREIPPAPPKRIPIAEMTPTQNAISMRLRDAGFLPEEIAKLIMGDGIKPPMSDTHLRNAFNSATWQEMLADRIGWRNMLLSQGWSIQDIIRQLRDFYKRDPSATPFDFVRELSPPFRMKRRVKDYSEAQERRAQSARSHTQRLYRRRAMART